jgi:predicted deacetylase
MSGPQPVKRLLLSIHDVSPRTEHAVVRLRDLLQVRHVARCVALLVVPNHWGEAPIRAGTQFAARLRAAAEAGDEIFLHGWCHRADTRPKGALDRWRAQWLTAGEGEFLGLSRHEAARRIRDGRKLLEDVTGRQLAGFIAPAWLYGPGAKEALAELDLPLVESHTKVWRPAEGQVVARGPVITWASRSRARIASSLAFARIAPRLLAVTNTVRIGVHPGDLGVPELRRSIAQTVAHFASCRQIARYGDLLATPAIPYEAEGAAA